MPQNSNAVDRRRGAVSRLNNQLATGTKPERSESGSKRTTGRMVELTVEDRSRIDRELKTLADRT